MKFTFLPLILCFFAAPIVLADTSIKHNTVDNYLQQAKAQAKKEGRKPNRLINESSPYLLQHAYNPVDWYPWGDAAFEKAKKENKPIFLSIGYSTCHWCHVMAHESFENKEIAALLNRYFVSIKVDREQRPDIDAVYMSATQIINGQGGWPMSVFIDNELRPFHAATYYPPFSIEGRTGFKDVLLKIHEIWQKESDRIDEIATSLTANMEAMADKSTQEGDLSGNIHALAIQQIEAAYDDEHGGFSNAPKFPRPGIFAYLVQLIQSDNKHKEDLLKMFQTTLDAMAAGGIYDQVGGGFHRYSVDANWQVPHFEKMLYTQALMVIAYSELYQIDPQSKYRQIVYDTLAFVQREMQSPEGGFYSALDADSERVYPVSDNPDSNKHTEKAEGAYYLWHAAELKELLTEEEFSWIEEYYSIHENGNIYSDPQEEFASLNIFHIDEEYRDIVLTKKQAARLNLIKKKLNKKRHLRPRPHLDDKILTAWNGMMITAYARASIVFDDPKLLEEAERSAVFIKQNLMNKNDQQLYRQYHDGKASANPVLSDYVWLNNGLLAIYEANQETQWLALALALQQQQDQLFLDDQSSAYFESVAGDKNLLFRSRNIYDGALPAANAIALLNLRRLSVFTKQPKQKNVFTLQADKLVKIFAAVVNENPAAAGMFLSVEARY